MNNHDLTVIVTGAARDIGREICRALARDGWFVCVGDLNRAGAEETAALLRAEGAGASAHACDVSDETSVQAMVREILAARGAIDLLVNNAGICQMKPILDITVAEWDRTMAINLRGTFLCSREVFRHMRERRRGGIISIASAAGKLGGLAAGAHYSASKAGVMCFTKSLALQAAPYHINVNAVCPGPTSTEMTDAWGKDVNDDFAAKIPWKEYARSTDIAEAVAFLASPKARYITGEILDVNGGLVMD